MASWNTPSIVNDYSTSSDNHDKNWYEEKVNIPALLKLLPAKGSTVLDFGCGPGNLTNLLSENYKVVGADSATNMLEKARAKFPTISFFVWDGLEALPDSCEPFEAIITKLTLEFIEDLSLVARNLYEALVPGGTLVVSVQHPLLAICMHPEETIPYWGASAFDVQIGTTSTTVTKIHRNLRDYTTPFLDAGFTITQIDEPEISNAIAEEYNARAIDLKFPKRLNLQLHKS